MSVLAMEPQATLGVADFRDARGLVLRVTHLFDDDSRTFSRRARYTAGTVGDRALPSYVDEAGVDSDMMTETLAEVTLEIATWRWARVPFILRSGKALANRQREVIVSFKRVPHLPTGLTGLDAPTVLRIALAPDERSLELNINSPGDPRVLKRVDLHAGFGPGHLLAYREIPSAILDGDPSLSASGDIAEQCWRIVAPVLTAWREGKVPLVDDAASSNGPQDWDGNPLRGLG